MVNGGVKPVVGALGTAGTISRCVEDRLDFFEYMHDHGRRLGMSEVFDLYPEITGAADIRASDVSGTHAKDAAPEEWLHINRELHALAEANPDLDGVIVTSGTSTLEELAYFLHLTHKLAMPVVVVGSMRPHGVLGSDAGLNLYSAVRVASDPSARGLGVTVVMNGEIHSAREVTKGATMAVGAFQSRNLGPLGYVAPNTMGVHIYQRPTRARAPETVFEVRDREKLPRVAVTYTHGGADGTAVRALVDGGVDAIVNAGFGSGAPTREAEAALREARDRGVLVVLTTRTGSGSVTPTGPRHADGFVCGDNLSPQKARILAMLALTVTDDWRLVDEMFRAH